MNDVDLRARVAAAVDIVPLEGWHAPHLEELQRTCFPTLGAQELMREEHFLRHLEVFPEGDVVAVASLAPDGLALDRPRVVGLGSGFFVDFDLDDPQHTFQELIAGGWYSHHDPEGAWYYGADLSVHPDYRRMGIGRRIYDARKDVCRRHRRLGIVAGGSLPGFARHKATMSADTYVERVAAGELSDPTLSMQLANGFEVHGVLRDYIDDSASDNWSALIVWWNPELRERRAR